MSFVVLYALAGCGGVSLVAGGAGPLPSGETAIAVAARIDRGTPWEIVELTVATSPDGERWSDASAIRVEEAAPPVDVVVVVDNSASVTGDVAVLQEAVEGFAASLLEREAGHRVGLVRVSTDARLLAAPTSDASALEDATAELFITNGWTALWDGVRTANDALEAASEKDTARVPAVVVFAAGGDNNSADQQSATGDGVDTTFASLLDLRAGGARTAVHTIELRDPMAGQGPLTQLSEETGGTHARIGHLSGLAPALLDTAELLATQVHVAFVPADCAHAHARVEAIVRVDGQDEVAAATAPVPASCG